MATSRDLPHVLSAAHQRGEDLVVVLAAAQVAGHAVRQFLARRVRVGLEEADRCHHESRHAERALEALLVHHRALDRMQLAIGGREPFDRRDAASADRVRQHRARVVRHVVHEHGAGAAFGAIAPELGAGEPELVAERHRQRFLAQDVDAALLPVHDQRDQAVDGTGRGALPEQRQAAAEQVGRGGGHGAARDDALDEVAA